MIKVSELMGGKNVEKEMKDVLEFERKIAEVGHNSYLVSDT